MPQSNLKSLLGEILYEELGNGNHQESHLMLYDQFLLSLTSCKIPEKPQSEVNKILNDYDSRIINGDLYFAVGLGGLGTECICQLYLTAMYKALMQNPAIEKLKHEIDWKFWDIHTGETDISHRIRIRKAVDSLIGESPESEEQILNGYQESVSFWDNLFDIFSRMSSSSLLLAG